MDFILSEQLGFPYPAFERQNPSDVKLTDMMLLDGKEKIWGRLFKSQLYSPTTIISQPIFKVSQKLFPIKYNTDFVRSNSYDFGNGEGKLFVTHDGITYTMEHDEEISFASANQNAKRFKLNRPTLEFQIELLSSRKMAFNSDQDRINHYSALNRIVNYTKEQIRQYDY